MRHADIDRGEHASQSVPPAAQSTTTMPVPASLLRSTLRALMSPRRLVPILVLGVPLVAAQAHLSDDPRAGPLGAAMCVVFFMLAPATWRALFPPEGFPRPFGAPFGRLVIYGITGAGTVVIVGVLVPDMLEMGPTLMTVDSSVWVSVALFWVGGYGLGRDIDLERSLAREKARVEILAQQAERAQLLALRSHLDPHFLFNTLNAIAEWCREDGETAERATLALSDMLRTVLSGTRVAAWPLLRELDLCRTLLRLHRFRDPEALLVDDAIDEDLPAFEVPPMILLPLVENAVKHGPGSGHHGTIRLRASVRDDALVFEVHNPGEFSGRRAGGEGIEMVERRLAHAYGGRASLELQPADAREDDQTVARVSIDLSCPHPEANA